MTGAGRPEARSRDDIEALVRDLHTRAFADPLLGQISIEVAHLDLDAHLTCDFW